MNKESKIIQEKIDKLILEKNKLEQKEYEIKRKKLGIGEVFAKGICTEDLYDIEYIMQCRHKEDFLTSIEILGKPTFLKDAELNLILFDFWKGVNEKTYCWVNAGDGLDDCCFEEGLNKVKNIVWIKERV